MNNHCYQWIYEVINRRGFFCFFFIFKCALMRLREPVRIHFGPYVYILISTLHLIATVKGNCQNHCKHCNHGMSFTSWLSDMNFESKWILIKRSATDEKKGNKHVSLVRLQLKHINSKIWCKSLLSGGGNIINAWIRANNFEIPHAVLKERKKSASVWFH